MGLSLEVDYINYYLLVQHLQVLFQISEVPAKLV